jgi:hypothetical protein
MKKIIFLFILIMLFKPVFPIVEYAVDYRYISNELCVNKAKPNLHCNGKCYLIKELAKNLDTQKPISSDKKIGVQNVEILFFDILKPFKSIVFYCDRKETINSFYWSNYCYKHGSRLFRPPILIS